MCEAIAVTLPAPVRSSRCAVAGRIAANADRGARSLQICVSPPSPSGTAGPEFWSKMKSLRSWSRFGSCTMAVGSPVAVHAQCEARTPDKDRDPCLPSD